MADAAACVDQKCGPQVYVALSHLLSPILFLMAPILQLYEHLNVIIIITVITRHSSTYFTSSGMNLYSNSLPRVFGVRSLVFCILGLWV